ncbi:MAG TPA: glycosyltransferase family 4 protein [Gemmatimonadales bacterium]|jgi:glycosyltransferase involved in cell wall biosynthesis|nr:glycosyltransferase family 4 protein [Gemmatimonadales bacterium]
MVIVHVVAPAGFGGLERVVQMLGRGLRGVGHEVHVMAVEVGPAPVGSFLAPLADAGVHTHTLVVRGRAYLRERAAIGELCRRVCPDVVHTHGYRPDVLDAGVARRLGIPVVTTVHGFTGGGWKNRLYERLQRRAFRRFDAVVAVSRPLVEHLAGAGVRRSRIHEVPNAWRQMAPPQSREAARRTLGIPADDFTIGWVGRLSYEKGPDVLLEALRRVGDLPCAVSVLGDGNMRVPLEARANGLGLDGRVRWHGAVPDAGRLFAAFDVCVLSSRTEGTPMVLFEAMAAGVPIIAARVGGVPDVVSPAEAALVAPEDPGALAAAIRGVHQDPAAAQRRAQAARAHLDRAFGVAPWLDRYEAIYRLVSHGVQAPAPV